MTTAKRPSPRLAFSAALAEKIHACGAQFVVTGGSGWIGQAALEMLDSALGHQLPSRILIFGSGDRDLVLRSGTKLPCRELKHITAIVNKPTYFIHCAFLTKDRLQDQSVESFVAANQKMSDLVAEAIERVDARGLFAPSSGAVYKKGTRQLDDDLQKNAYGVMKIIDEKRFSMMARNRKMTLCMPRLFNLAGPFINKMEIYALASMIAAVLDVRPITIRAAHKVVRSYVHVADLLNLGLAMLLDPTDDDTAIFDTAGEDNLEMGDLAKAIALALDQPQLPIERPERVEGKDDIYVGDNTKMLSMLRTRSMMLTPMPRQIRDTADYMRELFAAGG